MFDLNSLFRKTAVALALAAVPSSLYAEAPPANFTRTISTDTESVTVNFKLHPIRSKNFEVFVQQADGSFQKHAADVSRTYLGTVDERPGAIACGLLRADGSLWARISLEDGKTWTLTGDTASQEGPNVTPAWPTTVVDPGGAGSSVFSAEVGFDSSHDHFVACGGTPEAVVEKTEFSVLCTDMVYLRDAAILHTIGKIVIRADKEKDPYAADKTSTKQLLPQVKTVWNAGDPMGATHQLAAVLHPAVNGGLAWIGVVGTGNRYSANDSDPKGDFSLVWRHEVGHNWGSLHYEGGGNPEGPTIMSNNALSRFSSSELKKIIAHRAAKKAILDDLGNYPFPIPPRANQDTATFQADTPVRIDALANDSDSNGEAITLHSFDTDSKNGGKLTRSKGTGPEGRDEILYTPSTTAKEGADWFKYRIQDSAGMQAVGYVMVRAHEETPAPAAK